MQAFDGLDEGESLIEPPEFFAHSTMGSQASQVRIADILDKVLPPLTDWVVRSSVGFPEFPDFEPPTATEKGSYRANIVVDYHVPGETITGVVAVVYGKDVNDKWHVLQGADPDSLEPTDASFTIEGTNSQGLDEDERTIRVNASIPEVLPNDPNTDIREATVVPVALPINSDDGKVPADPSKLEFGMPRR